MTVNALYTTSSWKLIRIGLGVLCLLVFALLPAFLLFREQVHPAILLILPAGLITAILLLSFSTVKVSMGKEGIMKRSLITAKKTVLVKWKNVQRIDRPGHLFRTPLQQVTIHLEDNRKLKFIMLQAEDFIDAIQFRIV